MSALDRLAEAISYPAEEHRLGGTQAVFAADGLSVSVTEGAGRLRFCYALGPTTEAGFSALARYATGRLLREEAVLAWDPRNKQLLLWQEVSSGVSNEDLARNFELFLASCDWWVARMDELAKADGKPPAELVILP